ncbi:MAG: hypothetical protein GX638_11820 [Crenarchaeota archaeon]|nr:hypothetical protein [Thermoproteota archaeon]
MARLIWDAIGERIAEAGVQQAIFFPLTAGVYGAGVAWNGLTSVNEAPSGAEANPFYADNRKYIEIMSEEEFAGSIGCYTYPDGFKSCIGEKELKTGVSIGQQVHTPFGFAYRTEIINDTSGVSYGYKIHLVYNALAGVSEREHSTINESPELEEISFDFTTTKINVTGAKPTAHVVIDSTKFTETTIEKLNNFLDILYGTDGSPGSGIEGELGYIPPVEATTSRLPLPDELATIFA